MARRVTVGDYDQAKEAASRALEASKAKDRKVDVIKSHQILSMIWNREGANEEAITELRNADAAADDIGAMLLRCNICDTLATVLDHQGEVEKAAEERAIAQALKSSIGIPLQNDGSERV